MSFPEVGDLIEVPFTFARIHMKPLLAAEMERADSVPVHGNAPGLDSEVHWLTSEVLAVPDLGEHVVVRVDDGVSAPRNQTVDVKHRDGRSLEGETWRRVSRATLPEA